MSAAILTNKSPVTLDQVTPLARLTGEYTAPGRADGIADQVAAGSDRQVQG